MPAPDTARDKIIQRIRKLSKMTLEAGCSEAEAAKAAEMVAALCAEHNVSATEATLRAEALECIKDEFLEFNAHHQDWEICLSTIAKLFSTRVWFGRTREEDPLGIGMMVSVRPVVFFGFPADVAASLAMTSIICHAVNSQAALYPAPKGRKGEQARQSFRYGMAERLQARIKAMGPKAAPAATGNALVVLKDQLVRQEFEKLGLALGRSRGTDRRLDFSAYSAGQQAAQGVNLTRGGQALYGTRQIAGR